MVFRLLEIFICSLLATADLVIKVIPMPASITNKAEALPSNSDMKVIKKGGPFPSAPVITMKLTSSIPNIAQALAKSKPIMRFFVFTSTPSFKNVIYSFNPNLFIIYLCINHHKISDIIKH